MDRSSGEGSGSFAKGRVSVTRPSVTTGSNAPQCEPLRTGGDRKRFSDIDFTRFFQLRRPASGAGPRTLPGVATCFNLTIVWAEMRISA